MITLTDEQRKYLTEIYSEVHKQIEVTQEHTNYEFVVLETKLKQILHTGRYSEKQRKYLNKDIRYIRDRLSKGIDAEDLLTKLLSDNMKSIIEEQEQLRTKLTKSVGIPSKYLKSVR